MNGRAYVLTAAAIDAGAQRLASFGDDTVWPDSFDQFELATMRLLAERVIRSAFVELGIPFEMEVRK